MPSDSFGLMLTAGLVVLGGVFGLLRWLAVRLVAATIKKIDEAIGQMDKVVSRVDTVEERLDRHLTELPLHYQRRDDAIREYTAINVKLDRLYELMLRRINE